MTETSLWQFRDLIFDLRDDACRTTVPSVGEALIVGHELVEPCPQCGAFTCGVVEQTIVGDRLAWGISSRCEGCGDAYEQCDWDEMPDELRQVLIARDGAARLRAHPGVHRPLRVQLLRVFRRYGASMSDATDAYVRLTGTGITGTPAEMRLLARRLNAAGAMTQLDLSAQDGAAAPVTDGIC